MGTGYYRTHREASCVGRSCRVVEDLENHIGIDPWNPALAPAKIN